MNRNEILPVDAIPGLPEVGALAWWRSGFCGIVKCRVVSYHADRVLQHFGATIVVTERRNPTYRAGETVVVRAAELSDRARYRLAVSRTHYGRLYLAERRPSTTNPPTN